ncbi:hypothetical protein JOC47_000477 [Halanaerobacter jeridensis]|uniref:Uncharacterized protein n=1 Tax=Halanaerobacter jeridensis TaxID=706427 RepID=A0A939BNK6_9FIRM|nr:hypothetical protein [Halanaerobacter jeridensis]
MRFFESATDEKNIKETIEYFTEDEVEDIKKNCIRKLNKN